MECGCWIICLRMEFTIVSHIKFPLARWELIGNYVLFSGRTYYCRWQCVCTLCTAHISNTVESCTSKIHSFWKLKFQKKKKKELRGLQVICTYSVNHSIDCGAILWISNSKNILKWITYRESICPLQAVLCIHTTPSMPCLLWVVVL